MTIDTDLRLKKKKKKKNCRQSYKTLSGRRFEKIPKLKSLSLKKVTKIANFRPKISQLPLKHATF